MSGSRTWIIFMGGVMVKKKLRVVHLAENLW